MGDPGGDDYEDTTDVKDELLALLEHTASTAAVGPDASYETECLCEQILKAIQLRKGSNDAPSNTPAGLASAQQNFIRTSIAAYNNKTGSNHVNVREVLGNLPSATTSKLAPLLTNLISDRVDLAELLPATQDDLANEEAMGKIAITLTKQGFLAAELYAELIGMPGAWGAGLIDVGTLSGLSALVRRWSVECCGVQGTAEDDFGNEAKKRKSLKVSSNPPVKRSREKSARRTVVIDINEYSSDEEGTGEESVDGDYFIVDEVDENSPILSRHDLVMGGLKVGNALGNATLGDEFMVWSTEAREAFVDSLVTCMLTTSALKSATTSKASSRQSPNSGFDSVSESVVSSLSTSLQKCLSLSPNQSTLEDSNEDLDSDIKRAESNHDTAVAILRGLFPSLVMQIELPNGQKGKVAAHGMSLSILEGMIALLAKNYEHTTTPSKATKATRREQLTPASSVSLKNAATPSTARTSRKKRVSFGGMDESSIEKIVPPTLKQSSTPARSRARVLTGLTPLQGSDKPRPVLIAIVGLLQKLVTFRGLDRANVRSHIIDTICTVLPRLPDLERICFLRFLFRLCHSKVPVHRLVSMELVSRILVESWFWREHSSQTMSPLTSKSPLTMTPSRRASFSPINVCGADNMPLALLRMVQGRLLDRTPAVRARTAHCFAEMLQKLSQGDATENNSELHPSSSFSSSFEIVAGDFAMILRRRAASDEGATVRKAAINALVEILVFDELTQSHCSESDISLLSHLCTDSSVAVRKAAVDALTTLLRHFRGSDVKHQDIKYVLEECWPTAILPLVLDPEPTCVAKTVDLFYHTVIEPIVRVHRESHVLTDTLLHLEYCTSWRLLARVSERSSQEGASRGEFGALRVLLGKLADTYSEEVFEHLLMEIRNTAIRTLDEQAGGGLAFLGNTKLETQLMGVWCLFEAVADQEKQISGLTKLTLRRSFDLNFLSISWDTMFRLIQSKENYPNQSAIAIQSATKSCTKVLSKLARYLQYEDAQLLSERLKHLLCTFQLPTDLIGSTISALIASTERVCGDLTKDECSNWIDEINECSEELIASFVSSPITTHNDESKLVRALFVTGELSMVGFRADENHISSKSATPKGLTGVAYDPVAGLHRPPSNCLLSLVQSMLARHLPMPDGGTDYPVATPEPARAHAYIALGKMCLRNESLAKKCLTILARELHQSGKDVCPSVQSNALIVLGDLCERYTNLVDKYLPVMAACLQSGTADEDRGSLFDKSGDRTCLVRKHAVLVLSSLLLQDYIKWRGLLLQRFLVASADRDEGVAMLAEMTLCGPLLTKFPKIFFNNFVESLFVLNRCTAHPIYAAAASAGDNGAGITVGFEGINLTGESGRPERERIYRMMLAKMSDEEKIGITARLANDVLGAALETEGDLARVCKNPRPSPSTATTRDENAFSVLSDALSILTSPALQVGRASTRDDAETMDDAVIENKAQHVAVAKGRLLSKISRKQLVEMVLPILCTLKATLQESRSPLLKELMRYMVMIFRAYKVEVKEFLANDPTLLQEVEYDARQFKKAQKMGTPTGAVVVVS